MKTEPRSKRSRVWRASLLLTVAAGLLLAVACDSGSSTKKSQSTATPGTRLERLTAAYGDPHLDPSAAAWGELLADPGFETQAVAVVEFVRLQDDSNAKSNYDSFIDALTSELATTGGAMLGVNDTLFPGLEGLEGYSGGVSWVASFPTIRAYVDAMLADSVVAAAGKRREAVAEAQVLVGPNLVPDVIKQLGPNTPASNFPSDHVKGKSATQVVDDLLAIYPSGGADPTKQTLEAMVAFKGFADQPVSYINLYRFNDVAGGGAAALGEYNAQALPVVLAHGGRPKALANVTHHLVGPTAWDRFIFVSWPSLAVFTDVRLDPTYVEAQKNRVMSADRYGNLVTITRPQSEPIAAKSATTSAVGTLTNADGWPRVEGTRGKRYCEVLLASLVEGRLNAEVWNSYGLNDCPQDAWKALDADSIKTDRGVLAALLNGPRYWLMDAIEKKPTGDRKETTFGTLTMFRAASVDLGPPPPNLSPYLEHRVARGAIFEYEKGAQVYELVDPAGKTYIMQSYSQQRDATLVESDLPGLVTGGRITPPSGWTYRARTLDATVRVQGPGPEASVIQDDLANTYSLIEPN